MVKKQVLSEEDVKEPVEKPKQRKRLVVEALPTQHVRQGVIDGEEYDLITRDDALTEILENVREIKKAVA